MFYRTDCVVGPADAAEIVALAKAPIDVPQRRFVTIALSAFADSPTIAHQPAAFILLLTHATLLHVQPSGGHSVAVTKFTRET